MHAIKHTYNSLLADVARLSRCPSLGRLAVDLDWCINDAPKLEKLILQEQELQGVVEYSCGSDTADAPHMPSGFPRSSPDAIKGVKAEMLDLCPGELLPLMSRWVSLPLRERNPIDLRHLRQLLLFCYKAEHTHTDETEASAVKAWLDCQLAVSKWEIPRSGIPAAILTQARRHCTSVLSVGRWKDIIPSHGPGAVYDKTVPKGMWSKWFETIEAVYPWADYYDISNYLIQEASAVITSQIRARLVAVPKDSRGPRLICVHPAEAIWAQQGVRRELERCVEKTRRNACGRWIWPSGHVHFDNQQVNANLALSSSYNRHYATIDLKEASDRIADCLVQDLFGRYYKYFGCSRAQAVDLPDGSSADLHCYAPMGNATTFPVQSLVFWALCVAAHEVLGLHRASDVYVFGDDIVVPNENAEIIKSMLSDFGLVVNQGKSFIYGLFRESCGMDAFNGVNVTPTRWKTTYDAVGTAGLLSMSNLAQRLRLEGYQDASTELYSILTKRLGTRGHRLMRTNNPNHGGIAEYTPVQHLAFQDAFWHPDVQWFCSPVIRLEPRTKVQGHGWNHVLSSLTSLERTGRSNDPALIPLRGSRLKRGWATVL